MKALVQKLKQIEEKISREKGEFLLYGLFLRENAPNVWDWVVSSPWIERDKEAAMRYLSARLNETVTKDELIKISRIAVIEESNPGLAELQEEFSVEHGSVQVRRRHFFGQDIEHAFIITCRRTTAPALDMQSPFRASAT